MDGWADTTSSSAKIIVTNDVSSVISGHRVILGEDNSMPLGHVVNIPISLWTTSSTRLVIGGFFP